MSRVRPGQSPAPTQTTRPHNLQAILREFRTASLPCLLLFLAKIWRMIFAPQFVQPFLAPDRLVGLLLLDLVPNTAGSVADGFSIPAFSITAVDGGSPAFPPL